MDIVHRVQRHAPMKILFLLLHAQRSILVHFGSTNSAYSTFDMLGTQQYWITGIAGNNRVAFVAK